MRIKVCYAITECRCQLKENNNKNKQTQSSNAKIQNIKSNAAYYFPANFYSAGSRSRVKEDIEHANHFYH